MPVEITMPKLSDTMEEGTVLKWRVKQGDRVAQGDIIAEVETDKAAMEMEAYEAGVVSDLRVGEGETVPVGTVIAVLETGGAEVSSPAPLKKEKKEEAPPREERPAVAPGEKRGAEEVPPLREAPEKSGEQVESPAPAGPAREEAPRPGAASLDIVASPAARSLAREQGIDLSRVRGTGPGGRITVADVERAQEERAPAPRGAAQQKPPRRKEKSVKIRRIVAAKMVDSWQNIPHFYVTVSVDMTEIIRIRKEQDASINDFVIAAVARSLSEHPWINSRWVDGEALEMEKINIALAVATDRGLFNPVLRDCGALSLREISRRARELSEKAHAGRLSPEDMEEGTFTISNMGMLGVESFSAIITPPQAAALAVGTVKGEAVVDDQGKPGVAPVARMTLSADHRILDGADAADFLATLKSYLEASVTLTSGHIGRETA